LKNSE